jgi:acyl-CoA thioesterase FadM
VYPEYLELSRLQFFKAANDPEPGLFAFQHVTAELTLRYLGACFYDEPLRVYSKLTALGRSSATLDQAVAGADGSLRIIARMSVVRSDGERAIPWAEGQRSALSGVLSVS